MLCVPLLWSFHGKEVLLGSFSTVNGSQVSARGSQVKMVEVLKMGVSLSQASSTSSGVVRLDTRRCSELKSRLWAFSPVVWLKAPFLLPSKPCQTFHIIWLDTFQTDLVFCGWWAKPTQHWEWPVGACRSQQFCRSTKLMYWKTWTKARDCLWTKYEPQILPSVLQNRRRVPSAV